MQNRHWARGYQTTVLNDLYNVEEQLQAYDPTIYLMHSVTENKWLIVDSILEIAIMSIPQIGFEVLDSRVVEHIRKIHSYRGFNIAWELKESEDRRQREFDRQQEDMSYNFAKDTEKYIKQL